MVSCILYLEKKGGFAAEEVRLLHILSRRLVEMVELHHTQEEVRRAHECFKLVIENSPMVAVFGFDQQGRFTQWNREAERIFGIGREEDVPNVEALLQTIQPVALLDNALANVWETGQPTPPMELLLQRGDDECWLLMTLIPVAGLTGITEVFCMAVDITNRKRGERLLLQKSLELEAVFKALPDLYFRFDSEGTLLVGFAVSSTPPFDMNDLFRKADNEMYREKKALEARDFMTEGHCDRLQQLVTMLAKSLGLPEKTQTDLRLLAQFHDIGKVGIPDRILHKEGPLDAEEFAEMRRHCEIGHRIAVSSPDLAPIADWILKHHEWWNGQGYPLGLREEELPLACRILAIADAYDTMTNDRPYRKAVSKKEATDELIRCAGTQFDPVLVKKFLSVLRKFNREKTGSVAIKPQEQGCLPAHGSEVALRVERNTGRGRG